MWKTILKTIKPAIYPELCLACDTETHLKNNSFCLSCYYNLPFTQHFEQPENNLARHFWGRVRIEMGAALFDLRKETVVRSMIHRLKYKDRKDIGWALGQLAGKKYLESPAFGMADHIIPVPLSKSKQRRRGYNQSSIFGQGISDHTGIPFLDGALLKIKTTESQTKKSRFQRVNNVSGAFHVADPKILENKHILLVDDVITTGATLEACILELEKIKNCKTSILTIGIAKG